MADEVTIEIKGLDELIKKLSDLGQLKVVKAGIKGAALDLRGILSRYPPRKHIPISAVGGWASEKQRRWFFANLREGKIKVPYSRTKALGNRWAVKTLDEGFTAIVGNNTPYGSFYRVLSVRIIGGLVIVIYVWRLHDFVLRSNIGRKNGNGLEK